MSTNDNENQSTSPVLKKLFVQAPTKYTLLSITLLIVLFLAIGIPLIIHFRPKSNNSIITTTKPTVDTTGTTAGDTTQIPNYFCTENNVSIQITSFPSSHSGWQSSSNCSLPLCDVNSNNTCRRSSTPCFNYRTINNDSYCAPGSLCSLLEPCNYTTNGCASNTSVCVVNSCCTPQTVFLPLSWIKLCSSGNDTSSSITGVNNSNSTIRTFTATFNVGWYNASPDGYTRPILGINDEFPSPTIIVEKGDRINITVFNRASEPTTIHWHGLDQQNSMIMDGVPGVTQCSIQPNSSYTYIFDTNNQAGTFWYHSHYAIQYGDGLKGAFIIQNPNDPWKNFYDEEDILQISDWYHTPLYILLIPIITYDLLEPPPETGLINHIGQYNCTMTDNCSYYRVTIRPNTTKRFRLINTAVYLTITLTIDQHEMRVIEADGINLDGTKIVRSLRLNPGQRYSVLITAKQSYNSSYWIRATLHPPHTFNPGEYDRIIQPNVSAILQYVNDTNVNMSIVKPSMDTFDNDAVIIYQSILDAREYSDESGLIPMNISEYQVPTNGTIRTFLYDSVHQGTNPGGFYFNNVTFTHGDNNTLLSAVLTGNSAEIDAQPGNRIESDEIIELIINNIHFDPHPFHLHGHHAWLIAAGRTNDGYYNQSTRSEIVYNIDNAIYRDTYTINPYSYFVFRFKANNPGVWMMHCHNDWHVQLGMSMVFIESSDQLITFFANQTSIVQVQSSCPHH